MIDVYKRQAYVDASNPMIAFAAGEDEFEIVEPDSSFRPVSYTHLDVYKRQVICIRAV